MHLSRYLKVYPSRTKPNQFLLYSTVRGSTAMVSGSTLRAAGRGADLESGAREALARLGMLVPDPDAEREQMRTLLERLGRKSRRFSAVVLLNLDCNLDCGYCYEGNFRGEQYMSQATARMLVENLVRDRIAAGFDLYLSFYGGEPLLSEDLIRSISLPLQEAARRHKVRYSFGLVTNGTLLNRECAQRLLRLGLNGAKLTLDGPREIHDRQRPFASGSGSFDAIVANLAQIWDLVPIQLGANFYPENYRDFPRLLDELVERGITPEKVKMVSFSPVTSKSGCTDHSSACVFSAEPWLVEASLFLRYETLRRGFPVANPTLTACMVELADSLVVNCDGSLYKCPTFIGWEGFKIGSLTQGISDYTESHGIGNWQSEECLDCSYLPICFGGCRFMNLLRGKGMSQVECRREFLEATLEDVILQNIAHAAAKKANASGRTEPPTGAPA